MVYRTSRSISDWSSGSTRTPLWTDKPVRRQDGTG